MAGYSLKDLIEFVGCSNESILQKIAFQILNCLEEYNDKFSDDFGEFCICDILFDKYGNIKVIIQLFYFIDYAKYIQSIKKIIKRK